LILFRSLAVGGGEAFYAPSANGLISDYHQKTRAIAMSIHQTSVYAGVVMSGALGGYIAQTYGWKNTFYLFGGAGFFISQLRVLVDIASPVDDFSLDRCSLLINAGAKFALRKCSAAQQ
jgi:MFS family permease